MARKVSSAHAQWEIEMLALDDEGEISVYCEGLTCPYPYCWDTSFLEGGKINICQAKLSPLLHIALLYLSS